MNQGKSDSAKEDTVHLVCSPAKSSNSETPATIRRFNKGRNDIIISTELDIESFNATTDSRKQCPLLRRAKSLAMIHGKGFLAGAIFVLVISFLNEISFDDWKKVQLWGETGFIRNDYSKITGIHDLEVESDLIKNRCYPGKESVCRCDDTMKGTYRAGSKDWQQAAHFNAETASAATQREIDVVFYGDSITEGWTGKQFGFPVSGKEFIPEVFKSLFTMEGGGHYEGVPLGLGGDTSANLLWRLQHGELPPSLNPPVFWLLIGTNDFGVTWCSAEVTLIGIIRVIEEMRLKKPGSIIVVNSILPRASDRKSGYLDEGTDRYPPLWQDIQAINRQLEMYCKKHEKMVYFDATDIFLIHDGKISKKRKIDKNLMGDFLHPTALGYKMWGDQIVKKLDELIHH